jgi:hypothetical protein
MMGFEMPGLVAARIAAHLIADHQGAALRFTDQTTGAADRHHLAVLVDDRAQQRTVAGELLGGGGLDRAGPVNVAHRLTGLYRSHGNLWNLSGEVLRRHGYHHQGAVFPRPVLQCGVEEAAGHIHQRIGVAVDPDTRCRP